MQFRQATTQLLVLIPLLQMQLSIASPNIKEFEIKILEPKAEVASSSVEVSVLARFNFHPTSQNQAVPKGSFKMTGKFNPSDRMLTLRGSSWIEKPEGYEMVPLKGKISADGKTFVGTIEFEGCKELSLRRTTKIGESPLGGTWEGKYVCNQGETGLTLIIQ